ncbi:hypothetical protein SAMN04515647_1780 [Cohaesibacter sp. ES.047]|nr:hypothetical protein SAMN04515647_1780 [Cohaesibacter sp. ES.047]
MSLLASPGHKDMIFQDFSNPSTEWSVNCPLTETRHMLLLSVQKSFPHTTRPARPQGLQHQIVLII